MRNLVVLNRGHIQPEARTYPDLPVVDAVFDAVSDSITFVLQAEGTIEIQQYMKSGEVYVLASFPSDGAVLLFAHFVDTCQCVLVLDNGDIVNATYDPEGSEDTTTVEIVGSIDGGILAAAWSHDEETLTVLTGASNVVLLSRMFEPISEKKLNPDDINITDSKHVSVGWGKKETQFKGKGAKALEREKEALKHAGLAEGSALRDPTVGLVERGLVSEWDTLAARVSWRGDCEYFCVSTREPVVVKDTNETYERRVIRVFNRHGELDSVSEAVDGLEHSLAWKPQGALIALTQRGVDDDGDAFLNVVFFERNGLRHGEFNSRLDPESGEILALHWSCDSEVLALQLADRVQFWTSKNYHWYLKQEMFAPVDFVKFHPEKPLTALVGMLSGVYVVDLAYKVAGGPTFGDDIGMVVVADGTTALVTPLAVANVPPPIAWREFDVPNTITDTAVSKSNNLMAVLTSQGEVHVVRDYRKPTVVATIEPHLIVENAEFAKQVAFIGDTALVVVVDDVAYSRVVIFNLVDDDLQFSDSIETSPKLVLVKSLADFLLVVLQSVDGTVYRLNQSQEIEQVAKFPQLCRDFVVGSSAYGISANGKLYSDGQQIANAVTSLAITDSHLLFTNTHAQLCFVHLGKEFDYDQLQNSGADERVRSVERGSLLVLTFPLKYSVVLQAPRGNLETICPRIMVLNGVRQFISNKHYKEAFLACRTHRIDLDIIHDYDPALFDANVELFINQIEKIEHLDLFVSCLHDEDVTKTKYRDTIDELAPAEKELAGMEQLAVDDYVMNRPRHISFKTSQKESEKVNKICNAILEVLLRPEYSAKYLQTIITAYACQKPANLTEALRLMSSFDKDRLEHAVTHLCFLQDVNLLYNTALGLYDVKLALNIAQQSQKDPKEYLPFLQNLHVQTPLRRQFLIDDHLKLHEKALGWLHELGEEAYDELDAYVVEHALYKPALAIYRYHERHHVILRLYADHLHENKQYAEAALAYEFLDDKPAALEDYILAKKWNEALAIDSLRDTAERLVALLTEEHKYAAAAEIEVRFLNNVSAGVTLYCQSYFYAEAILLAEEKNQSDLIKSVVDVQLGEGFGTIAELLADCKGQMTSQLRRLRELRAKKAEDPYGFYGVPQDELDAPDNVSVAASETSTTPSFFTRYTGKTAGTAKTGASRRTAKNRKREERKRAKGRKGTVYEEEYLIKSVGRLLERLDQTQPDALRLIEGLVRRQMKEQAYQIQKNWTDLIALIKENIVEIHTMSERDRERIDDNGEVYLIPEIPVPEIKEFPRVALLDY